MGEMPLEGREGLYFMNNAMIFAAGLGTRLRPLTNDRPKALVEVNGRTLLEHNIVKLKAAGFDHIVVNVHHFGEQIIRFLDAHQNFGIDIRVSDERGLLLDTGGGLRQAMPLFEDDAPVLIHNVDIVSEADLAAIYNKVKANGHIATLIINQRNTSRYLLFDEDYRLRGWTNVQTGEVKGERASLQRAFSGIHVVEADLARYLNEYNANAPFPIMDFYLSYCNRLSIGAIELPTSCRWVDCGKVESLTKAAEILL